VHQFDCAPGLTPPIVDEIAYRDRGGGVVEDHACQPDPQVHITPEIAPPRGATLAPARNDGAARGFAPRNAISAPPPGPRVKRAARGQGAARGAAPRGPGSRGPAARGPALADS